MVGYLDHQSRPATRRSLSAFPSRSSSSPLMAASLDDQIRSDPRLSDVLEDDFAEPRPLPLSFLREVTENFSDKCLIGSGCFGAVYKGVLRNGTTIVVKKLNLERDQAPHKEITFNHLNIVNHPNIVKFIGYSVEDDLSLLVSDKNRCVNRAAPMISTDDNLGSSWIYRGKIITGVCAGLSYLHTNIRHIYEKPCNILLEENLMPKISGFGLLRGVYNSHSSMISAVGSDVSGNPCDVIFSVTSSAKGGIDIKIGSFILHVPKHLSVHHPLVQMVLFARDKFDDTFSCLKSMVPKSIFDMAKRSHHRAEHDIKGGKAKISAAWVVATAAPHHATGNRDLLSGFITEHEDQFVHALDGVPMPVRARGAVITDAVVLPDVWFVPGLAANLVSVSQLAELGYSVGFGYNECCIRSAADGKTVGDAHVQESGGGLYVLDFLKIPLAI